MSVSLYDLLDVNEDATPAEIRAAWKVAIADLDPTDRRFRAYNDAAGVLLDADKRAAYDAELAAERAEAEVEVEETPAEAAEPVEAAEVDEPAPKMKAEPEPTPDEPEDDEPDVPADADVPAAAATSSGPPTWALLVAVGAAVLAVALLIAVLTWPGSVGGESPAAQVDQAEEAESAGISAVDAATAAIPAVLSYDYRTLDADFAEAESYLTEEFADQRTALFEQEAESGVTLREQVVTDKVVVVARVSAEGLTRVSEDGDRATVVVFVDQDSQKGNDAPRSLRMWATLSMIADGDDWLLDDICTEDECG